MTTWLVPLEPQGVSRQDTDLEAARELLTEGTYGYSTRAADGGRLAREAFSDPR